MINTNETKISKDSSGKKLIVTRDFNAPLEKVWSAWTESSLLEKWWAPRPWKAITKTMSFTEGGRWLYYMAGPQGEKHWCRIDYQTIDPQKNFTAMNSFCDENGVISTELPSMHWDVKFSATGTGTSVGVEIGFDSEADLETIVKMGFKEGFTMGLNNLDELLA